MTTTVKSVTRAQLSALGAAAAQAGDLLMHAQCELAKGHADYSDPAWLADNTCLDASERRDLASMTVESALEHCVRAIADAEAQQ
jgi:hypothetical protein